MVHIPNVDLQHFHVSQSNTYYSHASHSGATYSLSNYFIKINLQEIFVQKHFFYVFFNGKNNGSEFLCIKTKTHFLFYFFQLYLMVDEHLFIITITTYTIVTTIKRPHIFIASIHYVNKIFFICIKNG